MRAGLHTGEIEPQGDDVAGVAVHIGARVSALAGAGELLVSSTLKDLVAGSGIDFEDRGEHELKGVPGVVEAVLGRRLIDTLRKCRLRAAWRHHPALVRQYRSVDRHGAENA
jgi:class 3 adenylate cyclase